MEEIALAHLSDPDEEAGLRLEEDRLADASAYREAATTTLSLLEAVSDDDSPGVLDLLGRAVGELGGREAFTESRERLAAAAVDLSDVARSLP